MALTYTPLTVSPSSATLPQRATLSFFVAAPPSGTSIEVSYSIEPGAGVEFDGFGLVLPGEPQAVGGGVTPVGQTCTFVEAGSATPLFAVTAHVRDMVDGGGFDTTCWVGVSGAVEGLVGTASAAPSSGAGAGLVHFSVTEGVPSLANAAATPLMLSSGDLLLFARQIAHELTSARTATRNSAAKKTAKAARAARKVTSKRNKRRATSEPNPGTASGRGAMRRDPSRGRRRSS